VSEVVPLVTSIVFKVISFFDVLYPNSNVEESEPDLETNFCKRASVVPPLPPLVFAKSISFWQENKIEATKMRRVETFVLISELV
jgi:hypothetical protein